MSFTSWIVSATERTASSDSTPARNSMKKGSSARVCAGRARTSPHASARAAESARAARFGYQPSSSAMARMRSRVPSDTPGRPFSAYETAPFETPARSAMSLIVALTRSLLRTLVRPSSCVGRYTAYYALTRLSNQMPPVIRTSRRASSRRASPGGLRPLRTRSRVRRRRTVAARASGTASRRSRGRS